MRGAKKSKWSRIWFGWSGRLLSHALIQRTSFQQEKTQQGSVHISSVVSTQPRWPCFLILWNTSFPHAQATWRFIQSSQTFVFHFRTTRILIWHCHWFPPASQGFRHMVKLPPFPSFSLAHQPLQQGDSDHRANKSAISSFTNGAGAQSRISARSLHLRIISTDFV